MSSPAPANITANWKIVDAIPAKRSPEVDAAFRYFIDMQVATTVHIDAASESAAKRAAALLKKDPEHEHIVMKFRAAAEQDGGGVYATKISG